MDVGARKELGDKVRVRGEEHGGGSGRSGRGREGEESSDVGEEVGGENELLLGVILGGGVGVVLVGLDGVEANEVALLLLGV